ncbi:MAG: T9SS type A sorting domain-containing protein [Flavobacteriales bacterium]|nr:T9SS type A sorting domain-containing protein [Flavobacteriales bacterium]
MNENINSSNTEVKLNNLKAGMYFYSVMQNNQTIKTEKVMVR